jgi:galactokinase
MHKFAPMDTGTKKYKMVDKNKIVNKFVELYKKEPLLVSSPGRVNLIGEHTDYNEGFVLPAAIDKKVVVALEKNSGSQCRFYACDVEESFHTNIHDLKKSDLRWPDYLSGVVDQLLINGHKISGFDVAFEGNIPLGAGMSSSAALECALIFGLNELFGLGLDRFEMVKLAQKAENEFVGVKCGIMDQFASMFGKKDHVVRLDCRSLGYDYFHFDMSNYLIVLCDTNVKHSLASSEYNTRRRECEKGVEILKKHNPDIQSLRDVTLEMIDRYKNEFDPVVFRRCRYVIEENNRVLQACDDLLRGDLHLFGEKMYLSHAGLRDDYEVSCKELDFLVDLTVDDPKVLGSRMMGGGFGGCTINLVEKDHIDEFIGKMSRAYQQGMNLELKVYVADISEGSGVVRSS